jgi:hypothetical protein
VRRIARELYFAAIAAHAIAIGMTHRTL